MARTLASTPMSPSEARSGRKARGGDDVTGGGNHNRVRSRIPTSLQAVFIASNRGKEVTTAPPESVAAKMFFRNWRYSHGRSSSKDRFPSLTPKGIAKEAEESKRRKSTGIVTEAPGSPKSASKDKSSSPSAYNPLSPSRTIQPTRPSLSPQAYLDAMIRSRGYSTNRYKTLQSAYYSKPTALQQASYDVHLIDLVRQEQLVEFETLICSGLSPNPCNAYGESLVHMICRRGATEFLQVLMSAGCSLQVSDDYGRTPLHDACWSAKPCFDVIDIILQTDRRLLHLTDCRGAVPLSYVRKDHWSVWLEYLESKKEVYWPQRNTRLCGEEEVPELTTYEPNTRPILNPSHALPIELAGMVASGRMKPDEATFLMYDRHTDDAHMDKKTTKTTGDDATAEESQLDDDDDSFFGDDDDDDDDSSSSDIDDDDDNFSLDEDEMADILNTLTVSTRK